MPVCSAAQLQRLDVLACPNADGSPWRARFARTNVRLEATAVPFRIFHFWFSVPSWRHHGS